MKPTIKKSSKFEAVELYTTPIKIIKIAIKKDQKTIRVLRPYLPSINPPRIAPTRLAELIIATPPWPDLPKV